MRLRPAALPALLLAGCAAVGPPPSAACPAGTQPATIAEAYFGRGTNDARGVGDAAWAAFLDNVVTPAFPDGLTVLDAAGQWRRRDGRIIGERSKVLLVALPGGTAEQALARLAPVTAAYRTRFAQESVMVTTQAACIGF